MGLPLRSRVQVLGKDGRYTRFKVHTLAMSSTSPSDSGAQPELTPRQVDHALIRRALEGSEDAFGDLLRRYEKRAKHVARKMVPTDEDAQDLTQEAFLRVFKNLERFDFQHDFSTWLFRIVTNLCIDHLRKRRPTQSTSTEDEDGPGQIDLPDPSQALPSDALESRETGDEVRACLDALAPHFQSVLVLRELEGLPCTEIAEIVGATHVTVRWRLHRGRKLFQEEWERRTRLAQAGLRPVDGSDWGFGAGEEQA